MYGPWAIDTILYNGSGKTVMTVKGTPSWVIKVQSNTSMSEFSIFLSLTQNPPRNMIQVPERAYELCGVSSSQVWYTMKRYEGHLTSAHAGMWQKVGVACVQFLSDLHRKHFRVYMDFRLENILISGDTIAVADYELITTVSPYIFTSDMSCNTRWYYYAKGAEQKKPLYSWRQDLISLGYLLVHLTEGLPFQKEYMGRRLGQRVNHKSTKEILAQRDTVMASITNPVLARYFECVRTLDWYSIEPPPLCFYTTLEDIFDGSTH
jgi:hypothetical protein